MAPHLSSQHPLQHSSSNKHSSFTLSTRPLTPAEIMDFRGIKMIPATGKPAVARKTTSAKRTSSNTVTGSEPKAKRMRFSFGRAIEVRVTHEENSAVGNEPFNLSPDFLSSYPACLQNKISKNPGKMSFSFNIAYRDFAHYLEWIQTRDLTTSHCENGGGNLLIHLAGELGTIAGGRIVCRLCRWLKMADEIDDQTYKAAVLDAFKTLALGEEPSEVQCSIVLGEYYWKVANGLKLSPHMVGRIAGWIAGWISHGLTRQQIEENSTTMDSGYLEALREIVPPTTVKIWFRGNKDEEMVTVDKEAAIRRCGTIAALFTTSSGEPAVFETAEVTLESSGDLRLQGTYQRSVLDNWAGTITDEGNELNDLVARYPELSSDVTMLRDRDSYSLAEALTEMYILAQSIGDLRIQRLIVATIIERLVENTSWVSRKVRASVAKNLPRESGLRRLVVDVMSAEFDKSGIKYVGAVPRALLEQLLIKAYEVKPNGGKFQKPQSSDLDKYCEPA